MPMLRTLAERALSEARDATPHAAAAGRPRWSTMSARAAAQHVLHGLIGGGGAQAADPAELVRGCETLARAAGDARTQTPGEMPAFTDGYGHSRPAYFPLVLRLHQGAANRLDPGNEPAAACRSLLDRAAEPIEALELPTLRRCEPQEAALVLAQAACLVEGRRLRGEPIDDLPIVSWVCEELRGRDGALHALGRDDLLDAWTYRELMGLHALGWLAAHLARADWRDRALEVARFHQQHTQPDYTTYQPWGVAVFAQEADTAWFAEQQLHDTTTHLTLEGGPGALLPGLILADAADTLALAGDTTGYSGAGARR